jgi:hypothetical protein
MTQVNLDDGAWAPTGRMKTAGLALLAMLAAAPAFAACPAGETPMLHVRIYFGQTEADGKPIAAAAWEDFLATTVTPRFPGGFTVYDARGQWRNLESKAIGREPSKIVEVDQRDTPKLHASIAQIRKAYRDRFHQQTVGLVTLPACASF